MPGQASVRAPSDRLQYLQPESTYSEDLSGVVIKRDLTHSAGTLYFSEMQNRLNTRQ